MKKEEKSKKTTVLKFLGISVLVLGGLALAYHKIPKFKSFVNGFLPSKETTPTTEIKTRPFRNYETFKNK